MGNKSWYLCAIKVQKMTDNGTYKLVTERYLVDALSYTEAEARITEEIKYFYPDFEVGTIQKKNYSEVELSFGGDYFFEVAFDIISFCEKSGMEKRTKQTVLIWDSNVGSALKGFKEMMKGSLADYEVVSIKKTAIMDVFVYKEKGHE